MSLCFMLTAGLGTRLRPHTNKKPKPCLPFLNLPLMHYGFYLAKKAQFNEFLFNKHHLPQELEATVDTLRPLTGKIHLSDETDSILGSGGALWKARSVLKNHDFFLVANGDEILIPENDNVLSKLLEKFHQDQALCTLLTCDHPDLLKSLKPVWVNQKNQVVGFGMDRPTLKVKPVHYTGYKVFAKKIFDYLPKGESNIFYDVLVNAISQGERISTYHPPSAHWYETGNFQDFLTASQKATFAHWDQISQIQSFYGQNLKKIMDPDRSSTLIYHDSVKIPKSLNWRGFNVIGQKTTIPENLSIENIFIGDGATLNDAQTLKDSFLF